MLSEHSEQNKQVIYIVSQMMMSIEERKKNRKGRLGIPGVREFKFKKEVLPHTQQKWNRKFTGKM